MRIIFSFQNCSIPAASSPVRNYPSITYMNGLQGNQAVHLKEDFPVFIPLSVPGYGYAVENGSERFPMDSLPFLTARCRQYILIKPILPVF